MKTDFQLGSGRLYPRRTVLMYNLQEEGTLSAPYMEKLHEDDM